MPIRWQIDRGFTIAANDTQYWWWNWFSDAGQNGPNKGPVIFRALPKGPAQGGNNTAKNVLVIIMEAVQGVFNGTGERVSVSPFRLLRWVRFETI
jgi:hypothetical protein